MARILSQTPSAQIGRLLYNFYIEQGICTGCRNTWATEGKRRCRKCLDKRNAYKARTRVIKGSSK